MATKKDILKKRFNRKHLFWIVSLVLIVSFVAYAAISVWRDYEDDRKNFSSVVESNQILTDTVYSLSAENDGIAAVGARDYCTYGQGKYGREGRPRCGREITLRVAESSSSEATIELLRDRVRALSDVHDPRQVELYERQCGIYSGSKEAEILTAKCSQMMKVWDMYPDLPGRTYN